MQQIINAIGVGTGVAVTALVPRYQGQGQKERALQITNTTVLLAIILWRKIKNAEYVISTPRDTYKSTTYA